MTFYTDLIPVNTVGKILVFVGEGSYCLAFLELLSAPPSSPLIIFKLSSCSSSKPTKLGDLTSKAVSAQQLLLLCSAGFSP